MDCWPRISEARCATMRPMMSVGPPAANGTIMRIERVG